MTRQSISSATVVTLAIAASLGAQAHGRQVEGPAIIPQKVKTAPVPEVKKFAPPAKKAVPEKRAVELVEPEAVEVEKFCEEPCNGDAGCDAMCNGNGMKRNGNGNGDEPLETDRSDFTEASSVVGAGRIQWEMGYTYVRNDDGGVLTHTHSAPEILCRIGITENLEFRLSWNYLFEREDEAGVISEIDGAEDLEVGVKIALTEQHDWWPELAMILQISTPTGARQFSNDDVTYAMSLLYGWDLPCDFTLGGSTIYANPAEHATIAVAPLPATGVIDHHNVYAQSVTLGIPLVGDWWNMYIEYFGIFTDGRASDTPQNYLNGGFTWLVTNDLQLDWRAGFGLNESADDFFTGAGMAWRY